MKMKISLVIIYNKARIKIKIVQIITNKNKQINNGIQKIRDRKIILGIKRKRRRNQYKDNV